MTELLIVRDLATHLFTPQGIIRAVDGVDITVHPGEVIGVVGESGCGKTILALSIMRLLPQGIGKIVRGDIVFEGRSLLNLSDDEIRQIRGSKISMVFQEPMTALNPVFRIGDQIMEAIFAHQDVDRREAREMAVEMLSRVGFPNPHKRIYDYPHQLSGGMRQRVMIAMALILKPRLMLADEPTTALDVTIQAQILDLMKDLQSNLGTAIVFITHDLGVVRVIAKHVAVMYAGEVVELAPVEDLFSQPYHPYTVGLIESTPPAEGAFLKEKRLNTIPGNVPSMIMQIKGCRFHDRCREGMAICTEDKPPWLEISPSHGVRCWKYV